MEYYIKKKLKNESDIGWWPEDIVSVGTRLLYCNDLPIPKSSIVDEYVNEPWMKIQEKIDCRDFSAAREAIICSYAYQWLKRKLLESGNELYFGTITSLLHYDLADDPLPYRSDIKSLLLSFLSIIEEVENLPIEVARPRHSQRVRLVQKIS